MADSHSEPSCSSQRWETDEQLLFTFLLVTLMGFCWYVLYEAMMVAAAEQLRRLMVVFPLLLMMAVHWLSLLPNSHVAHRATSGGGSSAWGVAIVLFLLLVVLLR